MYNVKKRTLTEGLWAMGERIAVVDGVRSPFCRAGGVLRKVSADDLGVHVVKELMARTNCPIAEIDELIFGNASHGNYPRVTRRILPA